MPDTDSTPCPACKGRLYPRLLRCADCGLEVTTRYAANEFSDLEPEQLHLLRIFVLCEGHIRDMEAALGVSYPTVKARLLALRAQLGLTGDAKNKAEVVEQDGASNPRAESAGKSPPPDNVREVLTALEQGSIDYDDAMHRIRELQKRR